MSSFGCQAVKDAEESLEAVKEEAQDAQDTLQVWGWPPELVILFTELQGCADGLQQHRGRCWGE